MKECIFAVILPLLLSGFCLSYPSSVSPIPPRDYSQVLLREIDNAKTSVTVCLYLFALPANFPDSPVLKLAEALVRAKKRGVKVEVLLDRNMDYVGETAGEPDARNIRAYEYLKASGVNVQFDDASAVTHSKVTVVDGKTVILGSGNWTMASFTKNEEANVLIRSTGVARELLSQIASVRRAAPAAERPSVPVPLEFLNRAEFLGRMVNESDDFPLQVYLSLLNERTKAGSDGFSLDYDRFASGLGLAGLSRIAYRRKITRALKKLNERYGLLEFDKGFDTNARVKLKKLPGESVRVPAAFWDYGWNRRLSLSGRVFYLLDLRYSELSTTRPRWSVSEARLAAAHHFSVWVVRKGVTELRRANLVEVEYAPVPRDASRPRKPSAYTPNALYDPRGLERALAGLEERHGKDKVKRAKECAGLVYEDSDLNAIRKFLELEDLHGRDVVRKAFKKIGEKNPDNPKRTPGYFINTIRSIAASQR